MQLSVIIVNYNVKHFLEQCLLTVQHAVEGMDAEVMVVDNHSSDGSLAYLRPVFPRVRFIDNTENRGFASANNQAFAMASGKYILFLNPDTWIPENCFRKCISHMETHGNAGALGIRMIDGHGHFLKESKRSYPSVLASFFKLSGIASLFPHSGFFNRYAAGQLDEHQSHEVEVLAGAFMLVRKEILDQLKGFDESFFMYGEDIDLSLRIRQAGHRNIYFAGSSIIHFKGRSSGFGSFRHIRMFYVAMNTFVKKHYSHAFTITLIQAAIIVRAGLALFKYLLLPFRLAWLRVQHLQQKKVVVIGTEEDGEKVKRFFAENGRRHLRVTGVITNTDMEKIRQSIHQNKQQHIRRYVFCSGVLSVSDIMALAEQLRGNRFGFFASGSRSVIGDL